MRFWKLRRGAGVVVFDFEAFAGPGTQVVVFAAFAAKRPMRIGGRVRTGAATGRAAHGSRMKASLFGIHWFGIHESFRRKASVRMLRPLVPGAVGHHLLGA